MPRAPRWYPFPTMGCLLAALWFAGLLVIGMSASHVPPWLAVAWIALPLVWWLRTRSRRRR